MDYRVELPVFAGPMDLLLHLVKKQEVDVHEIEVGRILADFLEYLRALETLDIDNLGEFVVMASTLMEIKSRELLPKETVRLDEELDPRDELIKHLLEYRRYRELMRRLEEKGRERERLVPRGAPGADPKALASLAREQYEREIEESLDLEELDVWFLVKAYAKLLEETDFDAEIRVLKDDRPLAQVIDELVERLERAGGRLSFREAFDPAGGREAVIATFMAILELVKQGRLRAQQESLGAEIHLELRPAGDRAAGEAADPAGSAPEALERQEVAGGDSGA